MGADAREACLRGVIEQLAPTEAGRRLGVDGVETLDDLRALVRIRDREDHERDVEAHLGFGGMEPRGGPASALSGGEWEREHVVGVWDAYLRHEPVRRIALLRGRSADPAVDAIMREDLTTLGGELLQIDHLEDAESALQRLTAFDPTLLVVPSALVCRHLESVHRSPLERKLRKLKLILAEHDLEQPVRSRIELRSAGWLHRSGRCGLPTMRQPTHAVTLATGSQILELLSYTNPEEDGRRVYAEQAILPEHAIVGQRYEVVVTSPLGFLRMRTDEHLRVVGFDAPSETSPFPRPRVIRLAAAPADVRLEGCTVSGAWLTASIRQALGREDPALVAAEIGADPMSLPAGSAMRTGSMRLPDVFRDTELGWMARTGMHRVGSGRPRGLLVRVEVQGYVDTELSRRLSQRIDENLRRRSPAYDYLRERDDLQVPRVIILPAGTRRSEERRRITELLGGVWVPEVRVALG